MFASYSIAEARNNLPRIVRNVEQTDAVELTRHGKPVAMLVSMTEYQRLNAGRQRFWDAYQAFREQIDLAELNIGPDLFESVRDRSPGRGVVL